jgi:hypothetical protein
VKESDHQVPEQWNTYLVGLDGIEECAKEHEQIEYEEEGVLA